MANETEQPSLTDTTSIFPREAPSATIPPEPSAPEPSAPEPTAPASPWIGRIIDGRYRVVELLAEGGMGTVFIAEHLKLRKMVALKTVHASFLGNEEVAARFAREAMASAQLEHPHVASAMDYGALPDGGAYLVLELVHGPSLRAQIEKVGPAPWSQVCAIGAQIADALCAAHSMGIVHRDLKPENVLLEARHSGPPIVKVLDFGIARVRNVEARPDEQTDEAQPGEQSLQKHAVTQVGKVLGTPGYMAPEQAVGGAVDERADLYALGVIMWEMLAGWRLFDAPDVTTILTQQFAPNASARLAQQGIWVPPQLAAALDKLLQPQPKDRTQSALELRTLLRSIASRSVPQGDESYRIAMPVALRSAAPKLRTVLETVITRASPRLQALWARAIEGWRHAVRGLAPWLRTSKAYGARAKTFFDGLPRKLKWSGLAANNVRELLNTLRRAAIWSDGNAISSEDVREALLPAAGRARLEVLNPHREVRCAHGMPFADSLRMLPAEIPYMKSQNFEFLRPKRAALADLAAKHEEVQHEPPKQMIARLRALEAEIAKDLYELEAML